VQWKRPLDQFRSLFCQGQNAGAAVRGRGYGLDSKGAAYE